MIRIILIVLFIYLPVVSEAQPSGSVIQKKGNSRTSVAPARGSLFAQEKIMRLRRASLSLRVLAKEPIPSHLNKRQMVEANKYSKWLMRSSVKFDELARRWESALLNLTKSENTLFNATKQMQEMNRSFNLQYLQLQQNMQQENRQFTLMSNIMKVKHDTAKAAINNVR